MISVKAVMLPSLVGMWRMIDWKLRRFYFMSIRIHHGLLGCMLLAAGAALVYHDRLDFPWLR